MPNEPKKQNIYLKIENSFLFSSLGSIRSLGLHKYQMPGLFTYLNNDNIGGEK